MDSRQRLLTAINNEKPDRLPCQVHSWMKYYLDHYLGGIDQWQAYEKFDFDFVIYNSVKHNFSPDDLANWKSTKTKSEVDSMGVEKSTFVFETPKGNLQLRQGKNEYTTFDTEHLVKTQQDFEVYREFWPVPVSVDYSNIEEDKKRLGNRGIMRTYGINYYYGQLSPWQSLCYLMGTEKTIMTAMDDPEWTHYALKTLLDKALKVIELSRGCPADLLELGGGAASNTVISPAMFQEFCLPYDKKQIEAIHDCGWKVVYHLCGGMMKMADYVVQSGSDGLETMTPPSMGADCNLAEASKKWGDKLFFVGGFDQNEGFENGTIEDTRRLVRECFEATKEHGGYILSPSDHFFHGEPEKIQAFVDEAKKCVYSSDFNTAGKTG